MSDIAIRAENLSKSYQIAHSGSHGGYKTLQEDMLRLLKRPFDKRERDSRRETFWALKDVSFEIKHGEVLGIIGRNGAGKSTLLKILSRITKPTSGHADVYGRIGSLLEVGTGFHPELTGRENVFLNGAVLGMTRRDIQKHFDEIIAFAEVEQFLDTPVKRYSSGMYMRLAFAVAAHLEPEVLVVDEVLAVGDAEFQKKCLGKMGDVARSGRTVLFVSHNMAAVQNLCPSALMLKDGRIFALGVTSDVMEHYLLDQSAVNASHVDLREHPGRVGSAEHILTDIWIDEDVLNQTDQERRLEISIRLEPSMQLDTPAVGMSIEDMHGQRIFSVGNYFQGIQFSPIKEPTLVKCTTPLPLLPGIYFINVAAGIAKEPLLDAVYRAISFTVQPRGDEMDMRMSANTHGALKVCSHWEINAG